MKSIRQAMATRFIKPPSTHLNQFRRLPRRERMWKALQIKITIIPARHDHPGLEPIGSAAEPRGTPREGGVSPAGDTAGAASLRLRPCRQELDDFGRSAAAPAMHPYPAITIPACRCPGPTSAGKGRLGGADAARIAAAVAAQVRTTRRVGATNCEASRAPSTTQIITVHSVEFLRLSRTSHSCPDTRMSQSW